MTEPLFLDVPFQDKEQAKGLGARWNPEQKKWYVPEGLDSKLFRRWLPTAPPIVLLPPFWLIAAPQRHPPHWLGCITCGFEDNHCYTIAASGGHDESKPWQPRIADDLVVLRWLAAPPEPIAQAIAQHAPSYFPDHSPQLSKTCYVNHCQRCGVPLFESYVGDRLAPVWAETSAWASRITLYQLPIDAPVRLACAFVSGVAVAQLAAHARRLPLPHHPGR